ncbi:DUF488 family protein [Dehalogenimonas etheniformans]|uniref:DUF488 domain-containing protein n=1 Tax=Dehalogenimonas etheniformans TaxID=1536648 RepID=A0A2P5P4S5_9CHLR|nr:DUF488 domain-containing protein [Dehalogenimonas etheniformans]PPD57296.1 DUF488 domain-containing protein [Dehalogenimonas etheniformans]QNT77011.1 DUF488 domain-containing protein [Dehalogenimonas etheniformans]
MNVTVFTIGHSTRTIDEFVKILNAFNVQTVADVRTIPGSARNPQFNAETLASSLSHDNIEYIHLAGLGGLRKPSKTSINTAWRNASFRGYADYMQTAQFEESLDELIGIARQKITAIMCSEAVPWRCHRSLIGDALVVRGFQVQDIFSAIITKPHEITSWAKVEGQKITYPGIPG